MNNFQQRTVPHAVITAMAYTLGKIECAYSDVVNLDDFLKANNFPNLPSLFGWGKYRKTAGDIFDLAIDTARKSLASSGVAPADVDLVYVCSTCFPGDEVEHIKYNVRLLAALGLCNAYPIGITLNNCTSFLLAIAMAASMVQGGRYCNILIVTADKVYDETLRFQNFALLSDAAASCIVTARDTPGFALVNERFLPSADPVEHNRGKDDSPLYSRVCKELLDGARLTARDVKKVFTSNIFRPITQLKETKLGFSKDQLHMENVSRYGHCFSADTVINLVDYSATNGFASGEHIVMSADAPNLRASLLLRRLA